MKSKIFLRIAAAFIFVHLVGHTIGHFSWKKPEDPKKQEIVNMMLGYQSEFMGATKSLGDYYSGYSLMTFFVYAMSISILWFTSNFVNTQKVIAQKILYPMGLSYLAFGVIEYIYFFPFAAAMSFGAGVLTLLAAMSATKVKT